MNPVKRIAATIAVVAAAIAGPVFASSVVTSAAPEPVRAVAAAVALPEAEAAARDRCHLKRLHNSAFTGGCEKTRSRVVMKCVDGSRVKYVTSGFGLGSHAVYCNPGGIPWGFYKAESAYLRFL